MAKAQARKTDEEARGEAQTFPLSIRFTADEVRKLDAAADAFKAIHGIQATRTDMVRRAVNSFLENAEGDKPRSARGKAAVR